MAEWRHLPAKPPRLGPPPVPGRIPKGEMESHLKRLWEWAVQCGANLDALWHGSISQSRGLPVPHSGMHSPSGSDPITGATEDSEWLALMAYMEG